MTDYADLASAANHRLTKVWAEQARIGQEAYALAVLTLAYLIRAEYPNAASVTLQESDQGTNSMFIQYLTTEDGQECDDYGDRNDAIEQTSMSILSFDLQEEAAWTERGSRYSGSVGELALDAVISSYATTPRDDEALDAFYCPRCQHPWGYHTADRGCSMPLSGVPVGRNESTMGACGCTEEDPS